MREIVLDYKPREAFREYHQSTKRFCVTVAHRRAGKTVARVNKLIRAAVAHQRPNPPGRFGYLAPFRNQAKKIAWEYLKHFAAPLVQMGGSVNESDLIIKMPHNHATIELYGADNAEAMRGLYFDGIVPDEAQGIARSTLSQIILPCLSDFRGWLDCAGTPRGWSNLLGELVKMARKDEANWQLQILRASETGIIPPDELAQQRAIMSENEYEQEFECNFDAAITGAVYGMQIAAAERAGRLLAPLEPIAGVPVHTSWDLGFDDATAIWWWQSLPGELRILDYYENANKDIEHYCDVIKNRVGAYKPPPEWNPDEFFAPQPHKYGTHHVPHDAMNELLAAGGRSIVQQAYALGVKMFAWPATSQQNAIEAARKTLERCWFDRDKCEQGLEALRQYQFEFDADKKVYRSKPRHDWASHAADAFELIGQVWKQPIPVPEPAKPRFLHEIEARELFDLENKFRKSVGNQRI